MCSCRWFKGTRKGGSGVNDNTDLLKELEEIRNNSVRNLEPPIKTTSDKEPPKPKEDYSDDFINIFSRLLSIEVLVKRSKLTEEEYLRLVEQLGFVEGAIKNKFD